jgi:hypothetical protein
MAQEAQISNKITDAPEERRAWRVKEFCQSHRISNSTFWKYVGLEQIKIIRIGGRVLVPQEEARRITSEGLSSPRKTAMPRSKGASTGATRPRNSRGFINSTSQ